MRRKRGILTYVCVVALVLSGAGASLGGIDEFAAPVVQGWSASAADPNSPPTSASAAEAPGKAGDRARSS